MYNKDNEIGKFLAAYATTLLECGATTVRIEKNVLRIAEAYGCHTEINIYPRHVEVVLVDESTGDRTIMSKVIQHSNNTYNTITELSKLSWNCYDRKITYDEAVARYNEVITKPRLPFGLVTLLTSAANASFCRLFGGDPAAMLVVFIATAIGFYAKKQLIQQWRVDARLAIILCSCISAILSCSAYVFSMSQTPDVALATSVLYLVPGIPYLNSISDLINSHYICATSRLISSGIITICLAVGLYIGLLVMNAQIV